MVTCNDITKSYNGKKVLDKLSLEIAKDKITSIVGVNGCGKTTLLNIIAGLLPPDSGKVFLKGKDVTGIPGNISYMMQKDLLLSHLSVIDNVALPLVIKGQKKKDARKNVRPYFTMFRLNDIENASPQNLSAGMRQRVAFLRTYINTQDVMLLDEPFSALDTITKHEMQDWFLKASQKIKFTALVITHDIDEAIFLSSDIYVLKNDIRKLIKVEKPFDKQLISQLMTKNIF